MDWFDKEMEALDWQLNRGLITPSEFRDAERELKADAKKQQDREDIVAAGRGHLVR